MLCPKQCGLNTAFHTHTFMFSTNSLNTFLTAPLRAACLVHLIRLDLVTVIIFVIEQAPWNPLGSLFSLLKMHINVHILHIGLPLDLQTNFMTISQLRPIRLTHAHLCVSDILISIILCETKNCEASQWVFFPIFLLLPLSEAKYFPQHFPVKHPQTGSTFLNFRLLVNY
jgi:hypothetical protein